MENKLYSWKLKGLAKGVNPEDALNELNRIQDLHGSITPEIIVSESSNLKAILHNCFEWDNKKAAFNHRLQQARILLNNIQVNVITDGESKQISVFEVTSYKEGYKSIDTLNTDDIEYIKMTTKRQLDILVVKLARYEDFKNTSNLIKVASMSLDETLRDIDKKQKVPVDLAAD